MLPILLQERYFSEGRRLIGKVRQEQDIWDLPDPYIQTQVNIRTVKILKELCDGHYFNYSWGKTAREETAQQSHIANRLIQRTLETHLQEVQIQSPLERDPTIKATQTIFRLGYGEATEIRQRYEELARAL